MRIKTMVIVAIAVLLTVALMQNMEPDHLNFLWGVFYMSKLTMLLVIAIVAFILGYLVGRPKKLKRLGGDEAIADNNSSKSKTLSNEDNDYIN